MSEIDRGIETPVYEQIAAQLRERIAAGTYPPGRALPSAAALAAEFGVAVLTVRSALRRLAAEGLVRSVPRRGTYVIGPAGQQAPPARGRGARALLADGRQVCCLLLLVLAVGAGAGVGLSYVTGAGETLTPREQVMLSDARDAGFDQAQLFCAKLPPARPGHGHRHVARAT